VMFFTLLVKGVVFAATAGVTGVLAAEATSQPPSLDVLLAQAADNVAEFSDAFSNVVAEEHYTQQVTGAAATRVARRVLRSDVLLLKVGGPLEWRPYRDVFEVDGAPVRDRDDRLVALFQRPSASAFEQALRIARESARFNIGLAGRTINTPMLTLLFLQRPLQPRFRFKLGKLDRGAGPDARIVEFRETARPTIIRGLLTGDSTDLPASGRFWIEEASGRVIKAEAEFAAFGMQAELVTTFRRDDGLDLDVPATMREVYRLQHSVEDVGSVPREQGAPRAVQVTEQTVITGTATYSNFRRFDVTSDVAIQPMER